MTSELWGCRKTPTGGSPAWQDGTFCLPGVSTSAVCLSLTSSRTIWSPFSQLHCKYRGPFSSSFPAIQSSTAIRIPSDSVTDHDLKRSNTSIEMKMKTPCSGSDGLLLPVLHSPLTPKAMHSHTLQPEIWSGVWRKRGLTTAQPRLGYEATEGQPPPAPDAATEKDHRAASVALSPE